MEAIALSALVGVIALVVGAVLGYAVLGIAARDMRRRASEAADLVREQAESRAREIELDAQQSAIRYREEIDDELREQRQEATRVERRLEQREESLERRAEGLERSEQSLRDRAGDLDRREETHRRETEDFQTERGRLREELERIAGMSAEEARDLLLVRLDDELREESARRVRTMEAATRAEADMRSRKILATVMQRMTSEITAEATVSVVPIPSDDLKGRIIGREGRNIRAFEAATGCD
ncbi:MAG: Rnase Y domain-containing protein, partial [Chloroflexi bacterium]|nr:Rnase Y domain-containing protein [Chloroflexota bacterium]